ncbi:MAG: YqeG family HAD IIIA-type phosphatase [Acholeplasmataceae bacterium]|nr:YqeG family HAD IIIA-type phosphatase [Acholeplasmataceae bacterium]
MVQLFFPLSKFIPYDCYKDVYSVDYNKLYEAGKRIILMDIDNTLIPYDQALPNAALMDLFEKIKAIGFRIILISNNHRERVKAVGEAAGIEYINNAMKPFRCGYRRVLKLALPYTNKEIIAIGDQLITDVLGANLHGIEAILVNPLKLRSEKWFTKINRKIEERILRKIKNRHPEIHAKIEGIK